MVTKPKLYNPCGGHLSLDFVNSIGREPDRVQNERLVDYPALVRWCRESGSLPPGAADALDRLSEGNGDAGREVVTRAIALREALFEVWHAYLRKRPIPAADLGHVNDELGLALKHARVEVRKQAFEWEWDWSSEHLDMPLWPIVRSAADLLASSDRDLVAACHAGDCLWLFVDRTRNHGRRWCDMKTCGNRDKVRQHRRRKQAE